MSSDDKIEIENENLFFSIHQTWPETMTPCEKFWLRSYVPQPDEPNWTFPRGEKDFPLTILLETRLQYGLKKIEGRWEIGLIKYTRKLGIQFNKYSAATGRFGAAGDELRKAMIEMFAKGGVAVNHDHNHTLMIDGKDVVVRTRIMKKEEWKEQPGIASIPTHIARVLGIDPTSKKMQVFVAWLEEEKAKFLPTPATVHLLSGADITTVYSKSQVYKSCMSGAENAYLTEMYAMNTDKVMLALLGSKDKPTGRMLIWRLVKDGKEIWYPDREYPPGNTQIIGKFKASINAEAEKRGIKVRWMRTEYTMHDPNEEQKWIEEGTPPVFVMRLPKKRIVPYMDTLVYGALTGENEAIFARSLRALPYHKDYSPQGYAYPDGMFPIPIVPVIQPRLTGGGAWKTEIIKCGTDGCPNEMVTRPVSLFKNVLNPQDVAALPVGEVCEECKAKLYVRAWHPTEANWQVHKERCEWSDVLQSWVCTKAAWINKYLEKVNGQWCLLAPPSNPFAVGGKEGKEIRIKFKAALEAAGLRLEVQDA